ncbi:MAG: ATP-binding protein [Spirochaetota bacterium]
MARKKGEGKLRIGNQWNAIRIIALSQSNPLKAIAEFVENSIDAHAQNVTIVRGKKSGEHYIRITDDGEGVRDFTYVATHIGDSIKRKLKQQGEEGIQGEYGIGLLSFWTVGEELTLTSRDADGVVRKLRLVKDSPAYSIRESRELFDRPGTTLEIQPILSGVRVLSGEKIQSYLASELRDRITKSGVQVTIVDRSARKELTVVPRKFHGSLIHGLPQPRSPFGEIYVELYLCTPSAGTRVGLYRNGTRVLEDLTAIDELNHPPWSTGYVEGLVDADFVNLTPGTRTGVVYDDRQSELVRALRELEPVLVERIDEQRRAEEEEASKSMLRRITRALREAFSMLPDDQYAWLASQVRGRGPGAGAKGKGGGSGGDGEAGQTSAADGAPGVGQDGAPAADGAVADAVPGEAVAEPSGEVRDREPAFFDMPGPLFRVDIRPAKATVAVGTEKTFSAVARDKSRRSIEGTELDFEWTLLAGAGELDATGEFATYHAPAEPELATIGVRAIQPAGGGEERTADAQTIVTVTAELLKSRPGERGSGKGLPGYTFSYMPGELWRSRYSEAESLITINSGHPDFVHASRQQKTKLRYVARLYAKEIVLANFPGESREELLERLVELTLYMDENLR